MNKFIKDIKLHLLTLVLTGLIFPLLILAIGLLFPSRSNGLPEFRDNKLIGFRNIGQRFYSDKYFTGRYSAVNYNAASPGASNKGPDNPEYLNQLEARISDFLLKNPGIRRKDIPSDLVTASGSGLDPDISIQGALIQIPRISRVRGIETDEIKKLVRQNTCLPAAGLFGPERVNVLALNLALDSLSNFRKAGIKEE